MIYISYIKTCRRVLPESKKPAPAQRPNAGFCIASRLAGDHHSHSIVNLRRGALQRRPPRLFTRRWYRQRYRKMPLALGGFSSNAMGDHTPSVEVTIAMARLEAICGGRYCHLYRQAPSNAVQSKPVSAGPQCDKFRRIWFTVLRAPPHDQVASAKFQRDQFKRERIPSVWALLAHGRAYSASYSPPAAAT